MPKLGLNRQQLATFLKNQESIVAFEQLFDFSAATPATIEEAAVLAGTAAAIANQALSMLAGYAELLDQLSAAPAQSAPPEPDNFTPAIAPQTFGSLGEQDAAAVAITGGAIDGTPIGITTKSAGAFTTLVASLGFGCNGATAQSAAVSGGPAATTGATNVSPYGFTTAAQANEIITKLNAIRAALVANGIMS